MEINNSKTHVFFPAKQLKHAKAGDNRRCEINPLLNKTQNKNQIKI